MRRPTILSPADSTLQRVPLEGADVSYCASAFPAERADALFAALLGEVPWEQHRLRLFGREVDAPRLSCWIGDPGAVYVYSRTRFEPRAWTPALATLRDDLLARFDLGEIESRQQIVA